MEGLAKWLKAHAAKFDEKVELRSYDDEVRGVHAVRDIKADETLIEIPLKCIITVEMGKATDVGRAVLEAELELDAPKHVFLMLFLLVDQRNPKSFFRPYYDVLPHTLSNMPIFWSKHELEWLHGSYLLIQVDERKRAIRMDYEAIIGVWPEFPQLCTLDEFSWARMCVCSRNFGIVVDGVRTSAMVPYADMLNHYRPRETKWTFDNAIGAFTITALQNIPQGAQIHDSYGQKCNHRFLLNYGFAIENNSEQDGFCPNEVALLIHLTPDDPLAARKQLLWIRDGAHGAKRIRVCASDNDNFRACLSLLRVAAANENELDHILGRNPYGSYRTASDVNIPVSLRNECAALSLLKLTCQTMLDAFPCTLAEDVASLESNTMATFSNERHARIHVKSEKVVLCHYIHFAATALNLAHQGTGEFEANLSRLLESPLNYHVAAYCQSTLWQIRSKRSRHPVDLSAPTIV